MLLPIYADTREGPRTGARCVFGHTRLRIPPLKHVNPLIKEVVKFPVAYALGYRTIGSFHDSRPLHELDPSASASLATRSASLEDIVSQVHVHKWLGWKEK